MRVRFINAITGTVMEVDESRVEEYKAAGCQLAADSPAEAKECIGGKKETKSRKASKK